ncbi:hypothetical protein OAV24_02355 [Gammaproteobacteria bacterium]|nr:hypothetical protein [Gammaproteobacteria bacterium]
MLESIFMWTVGLLAWANIFIWGTFAALIVLNVVIGLVRGLLGALR